MVGSVSEPLSSPEASSSIEPVANTYALTGAQQEYAALVATVAREHLVGIAPVHGAVNRPLVKSLGTHGLLRGLFGGAPDEPPTAAAARS